MEAYEVYQTAYRIIDTNTPLGKADCGQLCGGACCKGDCYTGMLLFPMEESLYVHNTKMKVVPSPFTYGEAQKAKLLLCGGKCRRTDRPLSCRIFPLIFCRDTKRPRITPILDPRARTLCPLSKANDISLLDAEFIIAVKRLFVYLSYFPQIRLFLEALSKDAQEWLRFTK